MPRPASPPCRFPGFGRFGRRSRPGAAWRLLAAAGAGLTAGATAAHLVYAYGHRAGLDLRVVKPAPVEATPTPEDWDRREPGRGRMAGHPRRIPGKGWIDILWRTGAAYLGDRVGFVAGGVTFFTILSLFPTLAAFVTVYGLFADPTQANESLTFLYSTLPSGVAGFIGGEMERLASNSSSDLTLTLVGTLALSIWSASGAIKVLFYGMNVAYHEVERRNLVVYNLLCLVFTIAGLAAVLVAAGLVVGVPVVLNLLGVDQSIFQLAILRWPVLLLVYVAALSVIYRFGPCRQRARWRWLTPGAIFAAVLSLGLSLAFSWYVQTFVRADSYGPLAAMMGFLLWTWISVQIMLMGAELNAEVERQTAIDTTTGKPQPLGERGAVVADTVGARRGNPAALAFTLEKAEAVAAKLKKRRARARGGAD